MNTKYDDKGLPLIHVSNYNVGDQESWVAMSGDKRISGVLAFGLGSVILEDLFTLPGVEEWSENIVTVIDSIRTLEVNVPPIINEPDSILARVIVPCGGGTNVDPNDPIIDPQPCGPVVWGGEPGEGCLQEVRSYGSIINAQWGQDCPYNSYTQVDLVCHDDCGQDRTKAGCVAVAGAIIAYYHAKAAPTFNRPAAYHFDYSAMLPRYRSSNSNHIAIAQADGNVGRLMNLAGLQVNMNYGCGSSGALTGNLRTFFSNGLGYANQGSYDDFNFLTYADEIEANFPVVLRGRGSNGGHAWVSDAYRVQTFSSCSSTTFMHMNWGWNGNSNDYFLVRDWSATSNLSFNRNKKMIHGIRP